jgi:hypothetical protein
MLIAGHRSDGTSRILTRIRCENLGKFRVLYCSINNEEKKLVRKINVFTCVIISSFEIVLLEGKPRKQRVILPKAN